MPLSLPSHGALGLSLLFARVLQATCLIAILGMTANFISEITEADQTSPSVLIGTLSVVCIAVLYILISTILYLDAYLPFLVSTAADSALLIALIVVAVTVGKPLSYLNCTALPDTGSTSSFIDSVGSNFGKVDYFVWAGASKTTCFEMKAIWGFSIALCVLFTFSATISACLWKREKAMRGKEIV